MTDTRTCASCGQPFTAPAGIPYKRYCTPRCRAAGWRTRNRARRHAASNPSQHAVTDVASNGVPNGVTNAANDTATTSNGVNAANGDGRCPHCHQPIAVIATLVPPNAAHIRTPEVIPMPPS